MLSLSHSAQSQQIESSQLTLSTVEFILVVAGALGLSGARALRVQLLNPACAGGQICTNADTAGAGKAVTLQQYLAMDRIQITKTMRQRLLPKVRGGTATTDIVILDIESPKGVRGYGELNDTMLAAVVKATQLRLQVARSLMPHAGLALYATALNSTPAAIQAYRRARMLGLWDDVTHLVPVLYTGPGMRGEGLNESVHSRLNASLEIMPRDGRELPMV